MRFFSTLSLVLLSLSVLSCSENTEPEPKPEPIICFPFEPKCYSGVVVGDACPDGVLIDVDDAFPIGKPAGEHKNVIAAVNFADLASLNQVGKRVYFTYRNDPNQQRAVRACIAITLPLPVPHFVLSNISATNCAGTSSR
ncbi:hypothetical protein [Hymenobacter arizonensis]|uniref:Uncharacterized protein n=1 Tax=Hymenobacter arizonensis TaxID=1227077 RepID=A0A1I5Y3F8_HYMAR|nr:hypothetical protein [Hymenobacter arizonensis]SFQ38726.1 hypothetical protein SAMN04515668_2200 [Hymenobacter arizonensis]